MGWNEAPPPLRALYEEADAAYLRAVASFPDLPDIKIVITPEAGMEGRAYGYFEVETDTIGLSPRLVGADKSRQRGILRHELGHLVHSHYPRTRLRTVLGNLPRSDERLADRIAAHIWGSPVFYDEEDVQNSSHGVELRPAYLG